MMAEARLVTLYSGSGGNCTYVQGGGTSILVDAGKSARTLCKHLCDMGVEVAALSAIFITHEHTDHISALETLTQKHPLPIYLPLGCMERLERQGVPHLTACLEPFSLPFSVQVGGMTVTAFPTPHDSMASVGYRIGFSDETGDRAIGVATDIGMVTDPIRAGLSGCEAVVLESNHDVQMLMKGPYPYDLKKRVSSRRGHLSNRECAEFACELAASGTYGFLLAHISKENNRPELAVDEVSHALSDPGVTVLAAHPTMPTELCLTRPVSECFDFEREAVTER
ncbi:MAG: MBL fold metallo-hydrolase [Clostridia bacterium]|nr:MBL fold metallo-hydrolase [Clostridia bacterium]